MLTRRGELPRDATAAFLHDCYAQLEPRKDCYVWNGWVDAVASLGLIELKPLVQQAFVHGSIDSTWMTFEGFERELQHSVDHPEAEPLHADGDQTLFGDTVAEMSGWDCFTQHASGHETPDRWPLDSPGTPHREPLRKVGRNDPCPCGSGKKFKKCCLTSASGPLSEASLPWEPVAPYRRDR